MKPALAIAATFVFGHTARFPLLPTPLSIAPRNPWRYLRDRDVLYAALVTVLALLLSVGLVWLGYVVHVWRIAARSPQQPAQRMVVLVFGRRLHANLPVHDYCRRLQRALQLHQQGWAEQLLLLGGRSDGGEHSEAAVGYAWLRQHGLAANVPVQLEQDSIDSLENLRQARQLLRVQTDTGALPPVALVTSRYHLARCLLLAKRLGFDGVPVGAEAVLPHHPRYLGRLLMEASYVMWIDIGMRWAELVGHQRMARRIR